MDFTLDDNLSVDWICSIFWIISLSSINDENVVGVNEQLCMMEDIIDKLTEVY